MHDMHDKPMPEGTVLVVPFLELMPPDKSVAAVAAGKRIKGRTQTPNWNHAHGTRGYTSAPGRNWRAATPEDFSLPRYIPAGASGKIGYLKDDED